MLNKGIKEVKGEKRPLGFLFLSPTFFWWMIPFLNIMILFYFSTFSYFFYQEFQYHFFSLFFRLLKIYLVVKGMGKNVGIIVLDVFILSFNGLRKILVFFSLSPF